MTVQLPVLYSFRRCPYAMRARMSLIYAGIPVHLREIELRNKPEHMLEISPKGTVPVLQLTDGRVIDESLEIMCWALQQHDPDGWLGVNQEFTQQLIAENDTWFKAALDRYKYPDRYQQVDPLVQRATGLQFLDKLTSLLIKNGGFLMTNHYAMADIAIMPFVRQFARHDWEWFEKNAPTALQAWLTTLLSSSLFNTCMQKYQPWLSHQEIVIFPGRGEECVNDED